MYFDIKYGNIYIFRRLLYSIAFQSIIILFHIWCIVILEMYRVYDIYSFAIRAADRNVL